MKHLFTICILLYATTAFSNTVTGKSKEKTASRKKIVLTDSERNKTKKISQEKGLIFTRVYFSEILKGRTDTIIQHIHGYIDSLSDSMVYIHAHYITARNRITLNLQADQSKKGEPYFHTSQHNDTTIAFPVKQLYMIGDHSGNVLGVVSASLLGVSATNLFIAPLYSINYNTYTVNKPVFLTSMIGSVCGMVLGYIGLTAAGEPGKFYQVKSTAKKKQRQWKLLRLE